MRNIKNSENLGKPITKQRGKNAKTKAQQQQQTTTEHEKRGKKAKALKT